MFFLTDFYSVFDYHEQGVPFEKKIRTIGCEAKKKTRAHAHENVHKHYMNKRTK